MGVLRLVHRWTGGLIGLLLAVLGFTGALLMHEDAWLRATLPHAADRQNQDTDVLTAAVARAFAEDDRPRSIILATERLGLHRLNYADESGAYADQTGAIVARWSSIWERPEIWLFDLHHHLLIGKTGDVIAGIAGLAGLGFVMTGLILWWPTRRLFRPRLLPAKLSRPAVVHHHRDLGVVVAPLLFVSMLTGATMALQPVNAALMSLFSPAEEMAAASAAPKTKGGPLATPADWRGMIAAAQALYPGAELRIFTLPAKPGGLISLRVRQQAEWLPNGRTMVWFDPADGRIVATRDAQALPLGSRISNLEFPIHAGKVGGLAYRLVMTVSGVTLTLLGTLAVLTFWSDPLGPRRRRKAR